MGKLVGFVLIGWLLLARGRNEEDDIVVVSSSSDRKDSSLVEVGHGTCVFCKDQFALDSKLLINKGNAKYPRYRCRPCHAVLGLMSAMCTSSVYVCVCVCVFSGEHRKARVASTATVFW